MDLRQFEPRRVLQSAVLVGFLLLTLFLLVAIRSDIQHLSIVNLRVSIEEGETSLLVQEMMNVTMQTDMPNKSEEAQEIHDPASSLMPIDQNATESNRTRIRDSVVTPQDLGRETNLNSSVPTNVKKEDREAEDWFYSQKLRFHSSLESNTTSPTNVTDESRVECDFSEPRTDVCEMTGDARINGNASSVVLARDLTRNTTWKIRPYARKWEAPTMSFIKEFTLRSSSKAPRCDMNHSVPAVVFSTGGFQGNFFHELTDVLIPLFLTSFQYHGEVQFLIADFKSWWVRKYQPILARLSRYEVINLDMDTRVHCFQQAVVGLRSHKELGIDPSKAPNGYSMLDFRRFLRLCYSLKRQSVDMVGNAPGRKPKLIIISRKKSRALLNERRVARMARGLGLKVVVAGAEMTKNLSQFAGVVNSGDIMMGVHGAGLSNMVFLPDNATVIQIVPWGGLKWACRFAFGDPAMGMGLRYVEYEVGKQESSLMDQYPKNHPVFTDPLSIHKQGFNAIWSIFLDKQNIRLDVGKFRSVLLEALQS